MSKIMHLVIFHETPYVGGAEYYLIDLVSSCIKIGIKTTVILCENYSPDYLNKKLLKIGSETICIEYNLCNPNIIRIFYQTWKLLRNIQCDAILFNKRINWFDFRHIILAARILGFKRLIAVEHWHPPGWPNYPKSFLGLNIQLKKKLTLAKCKFYSHCLTSIICMNLNAQKIFIEEYGYPRNKLQVIYNGIDTNKFKFNPSSRKAVRETLGNLPENHCLVLAAGRLSTEKGFDILIEAWASLPKKSQSQALLFIAGEGPELCALKNRVNQLDLVHSIIFLGHCNDMAALLSGGDLFVAPSRHESFGLAIAEAMATGIPVIATNTGGIPELLADTGYIIEKESVFALQQAIELIITKKNLEGNYRSLRAIARINEQFSIEKTMEQTINTIFGVNN